MRCLGNFPGPPHKPPWGREGTGSQDRARVRAELCRMLLIPASMPGSCLLQEALKGSRTAAVECRPGQHEEASPGPECLGREETAKGPLPGAWGLEVSAVPRCQATGAGGRQPGVGGRYERPGEVDLLGTMKEAKYVCSSAVTQAFPRGSRE